MSGAYSDGSEDSVGAERCNSNEPLGGTVSSIQHICQHLHVSCLQLFYLKGAAQENVRAYCDRGEDIVEAERCNFDGAVEQKGNQRPDRSIPWRAMPLLHHKGPYCNHCHLHKMQ